MSLLGVAGPAATPAAEHRAEKITQSAKPADEAAASSRAWIFTSATLGDDARLSWFTEPCGLTGAEVLRVDSPFDYPRQAALYVPPGLPKPSDPAHSPRVADLAAAGAERLGGRTMVLTTTLRALRAIGEQLQQRFIEVALSAGGADMLLIPQRDRVLRLPLREVVVYRRDVRGKGTSELEQLFASHEADVLAELSVKQVTFPLAPIYKRKHINFHQALAFELHPEGNATDAKPYVRIRYTDDFEFNFRIDPNTGNQIDGDNATPGASRSMSTRP